MAPGGAIVEIGSYRGKSAIVLASAAAAASSVAAIDPHAGNDRGPQQIHGTVEEGQGDHDVFTANLQRRRRAPIGCATCGPSPHDALGDVEGTIDLLYIDGAHRYQPARDDIARLGSAGRAGRHAADPRLVQLDRRHAGAC